MAKFNRRIFVFGTAAAVGTLALGGHAAAALAYPFKLGIASGDPLPDGVVLWTRLAPNPRDESGFGGVGNTNYRVDWEVATDDKFTNVVRKGYVTATQASAHSVHVEVTGLQPDHDYYYRFRTEGHISPVGRTRTAPAVDVFGRDLSMLVASCAGWEAGYYNVYRRMAEDRPDLVLHLGDYLYEDPISPIGNGIIRQNWYQEPLDLKGYRRRYAQYKSDADLQAAHAAAPWVVVPDDHEVENNYAGVHRSETENPPPDPDVPDWWGKRRAAAYRAYYENMPLRAASLPAAASIQLYRRIQWGKLATFHMLDTRQYRDNQACGDVTSYCPEAGAPNRSLPGMTQENWLLAGMAQRRSVWDFIGQQVFFARNANGSGGTSMDAWDGYPASRDRIQKGWVQHSVRNPVVLTGDVHRAWANNLMADYTNPGSRTIGTELVTSSVSSGANGDGDTTNPNMPFNPHLEYYLNHRGYIRTKISQTKVDVDFRAVKDVHVKSNQAGSEAFTHRSFVIEEGNPGVRNP